MVFKISKNNYRKYTSTAIIAFTLFVSINSVYAYHNTEDSTDVSGYINTYLNEEKNDFFINEEYDYSANEEYDAEKSDSIDAKGFFTDEINISDNSEISVENSDTISLIDTNSNLYRAIKSINNNEDDCINPNDNLRKIILQRVFYQTGLPYVWGTSIPWISFDCSGLSSYAYKEAGFALPRTSYCQANVGKTVSLKDAKAGDLLFFGKNGVSHVGIYAGNYSMVHASPSKGVCFVNLSDYNMANFKWAKNIIDN